jgi:hypothetical protein
VFIQYRTENLHIVPVLGLPHSPYLPELGTSMWRSMTEGR